MSDIRNSDDGGNEARLDAALARLPEPALPPGLAARIIAQASQLPQDPRREDILVRVTSAPIDDAPSVAPTSFVPRPAVKAPAATRGARIGYALGGLALAASLAIVIAPRLTPQTPQQIARTQPETAPPATQPATVRAAAPVLAATGQQKASPARPTSTHAAPVALATREVETPAPQNPTPDSSIAVTATEVAAAPVSTPAEPATQVADAVGPKRPVQGPPSPIYPNAASAQGLSIAGQGAPAGPATSAPPMGPPPGMGGGPARPH